jgi:hypothetical protein
LYKQTYSLFLPNCVVICRFDDFLAETKNQI